MAERNAIRRYRVGCVSFLNARPLIDGLDHDDRMIIRYDVPSALLEDLLQDRVDIALCPVVDFQLSPVELRVVPVGGIGSDGETHTVRLFSRIPLKDVREVHADTDSHTSIVLARLVLHDLFGLQPTVTQLRDPKSPADQPHDTLLLIGDKVVSNAPRNCEYPHQLDLGQAWKTLTGLPFVFAVWMTKTDHELGALPLWLAQQQLVNSSRIDSIVERWAPSAGFPIDVARKYLGQTLKYAIGEIELRAIQRFWSRAYELKLLPRCRTLDLYPTHPGPAVHTLTV